MSLRLILISGACAIRPYKQVSVIKSEWTDTPNTICFKIMMRQKWHLNCFFPLLFPSHKVIKHKEKRIHMIKVRDWRRTWGGWCSGWASLLSLLSHGQELSSLLEQCRHWDEHGLTAQEESQRTRNVNICRAICPITRRQIKEEEMTRVIFRYLLHFSHTQLLYIPLHSTDNYIYLITLLIKILYKFMITSYVKLLQIKLIHYNIYLWPINSS